VVVLWLERASRNDVHPDAQELLQVLEQADERPIPTQPPWWMRRRCGKQPRNAACPPRDRGRAAGRRLDRPRRRGLPVSAATATAGLAARLDFTLDDIEDLRIAVDEACAMLLSQAIPGSSLECSFSLRPDDMTITVAVPSLNPRPPSGDTFAWTVLSALAGTVESQVGPGDRLAIVMRKSRPNSGSV